MGQASTIEWTEMTWNPITGCSKISLGCAHCYAERIAHRFAGRHGFPERPQHFDVTLHPNRLQQPLRWKKPRVVFVNSMSDLFHEQVPFDFVDQIFEVMRAAPQHTFQILTKRSERLVNLDSRINWPSNVWAGVTIESADYLQRVDHLRSVGAAIKFLSLEPLLGPIPNLDLSGIDWVIVGGESGPKSRPLQTDWVIDVQEQCLSSSVPFFFKQWGGVNKKRNGRQLSGRTWDEIPVLRISLNCQVASTSC